MSSHQASEVVMLWDIDGTLIDLLPAVQSRHVRAVSHVLGSKPTDIRSGLGKTDCQILHEIFHQAGFSPTPADMKAALSELDAITTEELAHSPATPIEGVEPVLEQLRIRGARQLLLTGNTRSRAVSKVTSAGLAKYFDLASGFYGGRALSRFDLTSRGRQELELTAISTANLRIVIVGDTPLDVYAARHADMHVVAVATGVHPADDLASEKPDLLLRNYVSDGYLLDRYVITLQ